MICVRHVIDCKDKTAASILTEITFARNSTTGIVLENMISSVPKHTLQAHLEYILKGITDNDILIFGSEECTDGQLHHVLDTLNIVSSFPRIEYISPDRNQIPIIDQEFKTFGYRHCATSSGEMTGTRHIYMKGIKQCEEKGGN